MSQSSFMSLYLIAEPANYKRRKQFRINLKSWWFLFISQSMMNT